VRGEVPDDAQSDGVGDRLECPAETLTHRSIIHRIL
jgi:hypothetical protein